VINNIKGTLVPDDNFSSLKLTLNIEYKNMYQTVNPMSGP
jgi:hypothetical protein